ncbi:4Fe-4S binding protein [Christensenellaceae bacterium OttesenSCG-928-K19]|nr:4Fe-4S binding protein [Christensenellaceae bacterium OttesenSCG-928-K19]
MKRKILQNADMVPFGDAKFTKTEEGKTLLLLFAPYRPANGKTKAGITRISPYYPVSQQAHLAAKELIEALEKKGIGAQLYHKNGLKKLAVKTCGFIGRNTLFYHPQFGSFTAIQGIELDVDMEEDSNPGSSGCAGCNACVKVCPTNAVQSDGFLREQCIRHHSNQPEIPSQFGQYIYQLMGCERCQGCCPANKSLPEKNPPVYEFDLIEVLEEKHTKDIKKLIGANYATRTRILNQAIFYVLNTRYMPALPVIAALREDKQVGSAAAYVYKVLASQV